MERVVYREGKDEKSKWRDQIVRRQTNSGSKQLEIGGEKTMKGRQLAKSWRKLKE